MLVLFWRTPSSKPLVVTQALVIEGKMKVLRRKQDECIEKKQEFVLNKL